MVVSREKENGRPPEVTAVLKTNDGTTGRQPLRFGIPKIGSNRQMTDRRATDVC
jgi:hypothetical protein